MVISSEKLQALMPSMFIVLYLFSGMSVADDTGISVKVMGYVRPAPCEFRAPINQVIELGDISSQAFKINDTSTVYNEKQLKVALYCGYNYEGKISKIIINGNPDNSDPTAFQNTGPDKDIVGLKVFDVAENKVVSPGYIQVQPFNDQDEGTEIKIFNVGYVRTNPNAAIIGGGFQSSLQLVLSFD